MDLIVSDIRMPLMDGVTMLQRIHDLGLAIPSIIFVSGFSVIDRPMLYSQGVEAILFKPITASQLEDAVRYCLTDRQELWIEPILPEPTEHLHVTTALQPKEVIGRGGFSGQVEKNPSEPRVQFVLTGENWPSAIEGQGVVRWRSDLETSVGIEFEYLGPASHSTVVALLKENTPVPFIPRVLPKPEV